MGFVEDKFIYKVYNLLICPNWALHLYPCLNAITGMLTVSSFKIVFIRYSKYPNHTVYSVKCSNVAMYPTCYWEEVTLKNYTKCIYPHKVYCYVVQCNVVVHRCQRFQWGDHDRACVRPHAPKFVLPAPSIALAD